MTKFFIIGLLLAHFVGDWICQSRRMAVNKSKDIFVLVEHVLIVTFFLVFATAAFPISTDKLGLLLLINAGLHAMIDWNIWRIYAKIRGNNAYEPLGTFTVAESVEIPVSKRVKQDYWFYSTIAIDQFLHLSIIFALFL